MNNQIKRERRALTSSSCHHVDVELNKFGVDSVHKGQVLGEGRLTYSILLIAHIGAVLRLPAVFDTVWKNDQRRVVLEVQSKRAARADIPRLVGNLDPGINRHRKRKRLTRTWTRRNRGNCVFNQLGAVGVVRQSCIEVIFGTTCANPGQIRVVSDRPIIKCPRRHNGTRDWVKAYLFATANAHCTLLDVGNGADDHCFRCRLNLAGQIGIQGLKRHGVFTRLVEGHNNGI